MIKRFCDLCGVEITEDNCTKNYDDGGPSSGGDLAGSSFVRNSESFIQKKVFIRVSVSIDDEWVDSDLCKYCVIDAVNSLDDRPRHVD